MYSIQSLSLIALMGCGSLFSIPSTSQLPPVNVLPEAVNATMALVGDGGMVYCSGVISDRLLITAAHCVDDNETTTAGYRGIGDTVGATHVFDTIYFDEAQDLAILRPQKHQLPEGRPLAPAAPYDGDRVVVVGHPGGLTWTITEGIVSRSSRYSGLGATQHWMQMSAPIWFGNSGGPVFNTYGEVVGIASFIVHGQAHLGGAVHWNEIYSAVQSLKEK